jgi:hypothetical protein
MAGTTERCNADRMLTAGYGGGASKLGKSQILVSVIQWRMLPKNYPKWQSVYDYFRQWRDNDNWQRIHDTL